LDRRSSGEVANQKDDRVPEILKMFQLAQQDGVPQVQIGRGGSKPAFTRSGLPETSERSSFERSSDSLTISAAPS